MISSRAFSRAIGLVLLVSVGAAPTLAAEDATERAGVAVGVTAGNLLFLPLKAMSVVMGLSSGALSYVVTGGNAELSRQIWRDTLAEPYWISPPLARTGIGERPELLEKK